MSSDRMMEYYYFTGQDCFATGNWDAAVSYFKKATNCGAKEGAYEICVMGYKWETGTEIERDEEKAMRCYEFAGENGVHEADLLLAKLLLRGIDGGRPSPRRAKKLLEKASDRGEAEAASLLGKLYDEGLLGKVNPKKAFAYYLLAAERGDTNAMLMAGLFYAQGNAVMKDVNAAEMWIRRGYEQGDPDGESTLRRFLSVACGEYVSGAAGVVDEERALSMAKEAYALGDRDAFYRLGVAFSHAFYIERFEKQAFDCYRRAEKSGSGPDVWVLLGHCYVDGVGTRKNRPKGADYYRRAAEAGLPFGMTCYGDVLRSGYGVKKDEKAAMEWYMRAALKGDQSAILILKEKYDYTL